MSRSRVRVKASLGVSPLRTTISTPSAARKNYGVGRGMMGGNHDDELELGTEFGDGSTSL